MAEVPKELVNKTYEAFNIAVKSGKVRKGTNETTKAIERGKAQIVAVAQDVSPPEIVAHLPALCKERDIPLIQVPKKEELGKAAGLSVPTASAAIVDAGDAEKTVKDLGAKLESLGESSGKKKDVEEKKEKTAEKKKEKKKEESKEKSE